MSLSIAVFNQRQHEQFILRGGAAQIGACLENSTAILTDGENLSLNIDDPLVSGKHLTIAWDGASREIELTNHGGSIALSSGARIHLGSSSLPLPVSLCVGDTQIQVFDNEMIHDLDHALTSLKAVTDHSAKRASDSRREVSPGPSTLEAWLNTLSQMQRAAAGSKELFQLAARAVFNPGGLDGAMILTSSSDGLHVAASHIPYPDHGVGFRNDIVRQAIDRREAIYHDARLSDGKSGNFDEAVPGSIESCDELHAAVVCPVMDADEEVVAVVYGFRSLHRRNSRNGVRILEAQFVQVVADALSAGMVRLEAESKAARSKVLLEQAFAPSIARRLQTEPDALKGQTREVTVLFADLRGFSTISERIGAQESFELLTDVMDQFSYAITDHDGVIIDYYGDGVSAFWNAPLDQPEHAVMACQSAFEILDCLPAINEKWENRIGCKLNCGIGIHTGDARVGNSGSRSRLKYGPRGTTVNLASRLESMTKQVGVPLVVSGATAERVSHVFDSTRVVRSILRGMTTSVDLCRLFPKTRLIGDDLNQREYSKCLELFESGKLSESLACLEILQQRQPLDSAVRFLKNIVEQQQSLSGDAVNESESSNFDAQTSRRILNDSRESNGTGKKH